MKIRARSLSVRASCLLLIVLIAVANWQVFIPITEASCTRFTAVLEGATAHDKYISLDFGDSRRFRIVHATALEVLLEEEAEGKEYDIFARYHHQRKRSGYYEVLALTDADGAIYLTLEQSEAIRQGMLPKRIALLAALYAAGCGIIFLAHKRKKTAGKEVTSPETETDVA